MRNAVDDDLGEANMLAARLAAGEDPQLIWSEKPLGRRTCEELAELEPATLCSAVSLNSHTHPTLAALIGARALKEASNAQRGRNAGVAGKLAGAMRALACLLTVHSLARPASHVCCSAVNKARAVRCWPAPKLASCDRAHAAPSRRRRGRRHFRLQLARPLSRTQLA